MAGAGGGEAAGPEAIPPPPGTTPPARRRRLGASLLWLACGVLLVLAGAGAAYMTWPLWNQSVPGYLRTVLAPVMDAGRDTALRRRDTALRQSVGALGQRVGAIETRTAEIESRIMLMRESLAKAAATGAAGAAGRAGSDAENAAARARLAALETSVEKSLSQLHEAVRGVPALSQRLDNVLTDIATLQAGRDDAAAAAGGVRPAGGGREIAALRRDNQALSATLAELTRRLATLETRNAAPSETASAAGTASGALLLAVGQLRDALRGSGPYAAELDAVQAIGAGDAAVEKAAAVLAPHAARGIPARALLQARFGATATSLVRLALTPEGEGWWRETVARLSRVVTVRRTGAVADGAGGITAMVARAETHLGVGDLPGAVAALAKLDGAAAKAAAGWLDGARRRIAAEAALSALTAHAIATLDAGRAADTARPAVPGGRAAPGG